MIPNLKSISLSARRTKEILRYSYPALAGIFTGTLDVLWFCFGLGWVPASQLSSLCTCLSLKSIYFECQNGLFVMWTCRAIVTIVSARRTDSSSAWTANLCWRRSWPDFVVLGLECCFSLRGIHRLVLAMLPELVHNMEYWVKRFVTSEFLLNLAFLHGHSCVL